MFLTLTLKKKTKKKLESFVQSRAHFNKLKSKKMNNAVKWSPDEEHIYARHMGLHRKFESN